MAVLGLISVARPAASGHRVVGWASSFLPRRLAPTRPRSKGTLMEQLMEMPRTSHAHGARTAHTTRWFPVCKLRDLEDSWGEAALINGQQVALFRVGENDVFAVSHADPATASMSWPAVWLAPAATRTPSPHRCTKRSTRWQRGSASAGQNYPWTPSRCALWPAVSRWSSRAGPAR